jgi:hypothetical protein
MNTSKENRAHERVQPDNLLAFLSCKSKVVKIIDISEGGMAFHYVSRNRLIETLSSLQLDILHSNSNYLNGIDVFVISDSPIVGGTISIRRCGVKFNNLTSYQQKKLDEFLLHYSEGRA